MSFLTHYNNIVLVLVMILLLFSLVHSQDFVKSRATYYGSPDGLGTPSGACGFGEYGRNVTNGYVAGVSALYRDGIGCGGCYQVRCKAVECTDEGVQVVATDWGFGDRTDFILSSRAYAKMAQPGYEAQLVSYGVVDIDYRRVPCQFNGPDLIVKIRDWRPNYFALTILYTPGQVDVSLVEWQGQNEWRPMRKAFGAVWDTVNQPSTVVVRFYVSAPVTGIKILLPSSSTANGHNGDQIRATFVVQNQPPLN